MDEKSNRDTVGVINYWNMLFWNKQILQPLQASIAFYLNPNIAKDLVFGESPLAVNLAVCSVGFFMYDLIDIIQITGFPPTKRKNLI